jgi:hypothetical protein
MAYRRKKDAALESSAWGSFISDAQAVIADAKIPLFFIESPKNWGFFLREGWHPDEPSGFVASRVDAKQRIAIIRLVESYFEAGFPYESCIDTVGPDAEKRLRKKFGMRNDKERP